MAYGGTIGEAMDSGYGGGDTRFLVYKVHGTNPVTDDRESAVDAVYAAAPSAIGALPKRDVCNIRTMGVELDYEITVRYSSADIGNFTIPEAATLLSFSTGGGTQHITQSISTLGMSSPTGADGAIPTNGAIGTGEAGDVSGVDIPVGVFNFRLRHKYAPADITLDLFNTLYKSVGHVNDDSWTVTVNFGLSTLTLTFDALQVRFNGADASEPDSDGSVWITFDMSAGVNVAADDIPLPPGWPPIAGGKSAWDYLWIQYRRDVIPAGDDTLWYQTTPLSAYVEQIVDDFDFTLFGLPA